MSVFQLIVLVIKPTSFTVLVHSHHFELKKKALINPLYITCLAPNSREAKLTAGGALHSLRDEYFGVGKDKNRGE